MNREEVINVLTNALDGLGTAWIVDEAISAAIELLAEDSNVPVKQPDPITGLVPCGCAGKPEYHTTCSIRESEYGYVASVKMHAECPDCHAKTAEYYAFLYSDGALEELQRRVMDAWNTMRGYKK